MLEQLDLDEVAEAYFSVGEPNRPEYERLFIRAHGEAIFPLLRAMLIVIGRYQSDSDMLARLGRQTPLEEKGARGEWTQLSIEPIVQRAYSIVQKIEQSKVPASIFLCNALLQEQGKMRLAAALLLSLYESVGEEVRTRVQSVLHLIDPGKRGQESLLALLEIVLSRTGDAQSRRVVEERARHSGLSLTQWTERAKNRALMALQINERAGFGGKESNDYLQDESPSSSEVTLLVLNAIIRELFLDTVNLPPQLLERHGPCWTIATGLLRYPHLLIETTLQLPEDTTIRDAYWRGLTRPLFLLHLASLALPMRSMNPEELKRAVFRLAPQSEEEFGRENLALAVSLLWDDLSGRVLINRFVLKESRTATNRYFQMGLEVAKQIFLMYTALLTIFSSAIVQPREEMVPLLPRLSKNEGTPFEGPQPHLPVQEERSQVLRNGQRSSRSTPKIPQAAQDLIKVLLRIYELSHDETDEGTASEQLFEEWKQLIQRSDLKKYSALWTASHIAFGDFCERQFASTGKERFIQAARQAYSRPLEKSTVWKADLGTRYACAGRLGKLFCEHVADLKIPASSLVRAIHDTYLDMLKTNERLYQRSLYRESKRQLQARNDLIAARIIETCVYLSEQGEAEAVNWRREAFMIAETAKSRMLREEIALADRLPPTEIPAELYETEKQCLNGLRAIYADVTARELMEVPESPSVLDEDNAKQNELRLKLEQTWAQMEHLGKEEAHAYVLARRDEALQWEGLRWETFQRVADERLGKEFALVSLSRLPDAVLFSVLRAGRDAPELCKVPLPQATLDKYLRNYKEEILNREPSRGDSTNLWQRLGERLFPDLEPLLDGVKYVYFIPHGDFHKIPLHALTLHGKPFIERWAVAYAPSISVLESTLSRPERVGSVLVMGYPRPDDSELLTGTILEEAEKVAAHFNTTALLSNVASAQVLREHGQSARLIHIACHAGFDEEDPLKSGIDLSDERFTARHWLQLRLHADLVTLSACLTARSAVWPGDDLVGLTRSVLFAGASSLLTCLWRVYSPTTRDWMLKFYQNLQGSSAVDKITAFQKATLELQDDLERQDRTPDPYYWAPFVLFGNFR